MYFPWWFVLLALAVVAKALVMGESLESVPWVWLALGSVVLRVEELEKQIKERE